MKLLVLEVLVATGFGWIFVGLGLMTLGATLGPADLKFWGGFLCAVGGLLATGCLLTFLRATR